MKRSQALQPLSHQHHNSLMACLLIRKGVAKGANTDMISDFARKFFLEDILPHLEAEERFVFPLLAVKSARMHSMLQTDHERLRLLGERLNMQHQEPELLSVFANLLEEHIRFEERLVFNYLQQHLMDDEGQSLEHSLHHLKAKKCTDYPVKFWE